MGRVAIEYIKCGNANLAMHGSDINSIITTGHSFWIVGQKRNSGRGNDSLLQLYLTIQR